MDVVRAYARLLMEFMTIEWETLGDNVALKLKIGFIIVRTSVDAWRRLVSACFAPRFRPGSKLVDAADVPADAWASRNSWATAFTKLDNPKYFTLQTGEQLASMAAESYAGKTDLMLL